MTQFFNHESEGEITNIKDTFELKNWIHHLDYIKKEIEYLIAIIKKHNNNLELLQLLEDQQLKNSEELSAFYNYGPSIAESQECDDVDCDIFYLNKHEEFRNRYINYLEDYRGMKTQVYESLLK